MRSYTSPSTSSRLDDGRLSGVGHNPEDARICADVLIASDLRGVESHGVGRLKYYYDAFAPACSPPTPSSRSCTRRNHSRGGWPSRHGPRHRLPRMRLAMNKAGSMAWERSSCATAPTLASPVIIPCWRPARA